MKHRLHHIYAVKRHTQIGVTKCILGRLSIVLSRVGSTQSAHHILICGLVGSSKNERETAEMDGYVINYREKGRNVTSKRNFFETNFVSRDMPNLFPKDLIP